MKIMTCCLLIINLPLLASDFKSPKSEKLAAQLVRSINQKLTEIAEHEIAAGVAPQDIVLKLSQLERYDSGRFGAILDKQTLGKIVSVTPKSPANQIGLQSGDTLLSINNSVVSQSDDTWLSLLQYAQDKTPVSITIQRDNKQLKLNGTFKAKFTPHWELTSSNEQMDTESIQTILMPRVHSANKTIVHKDSKETLTDTSSCGRIFEYNSANFDFRIASIIKIDSKKVPPGKTRHKLSVGPHNIKYKNANFTINIKPNTVYHVAPVQGNSWFDESGKGLLPEDYNGPAIIKTTIQKCEM